MPDNGQFDFEQYLDRLADSLKPDDAGAPRRQQSDIPSRFDSAMAAQRRIDKSVNRLFGDAGDPQTADRILKSARDCVRRPGARRRSGWLRVAAVLALSMLALWRFGGGGDTKKSDPYLITEWRSMATVYDDVARSGFDAEGRSFDPNQFARVLQGRFSESLGVKIRSDSVHPTGYGYCNTVTEKTTCLITVVSEAGSDSAGRAKGVGVLVFIDRAEVDAGKAFPLDASLNVFERRIGSLALYEVSPLDESYALDLFESYIPSDQ